MQVISDAKELEKHTYIKTRNPNIFPKKERLGLAQRSALRNCRKLIHHIELAHEILSGLGDDAFAHWSRMAAVVKNQTAKWYKSDKERAAKMDAQARHQ